MEAKVKSLDKALRILSSFSLENPELGISDLSRRFDLYKSNVHNIVSTLEQNGFLEKNETTGKYRLGLGVLRLAHVVSSSMDFQKVVHRCVNELSASINEIVYFGVPYGHNVMYMEGAYPEKIYSLRWGAGMVAPLVCTGIGKAILAFSDGKVIADVLAQPITAFTDSTITDPDALRAELELTRQRGYSTDNMEHEYGIKCVGAPVFNRNNEILGGLSTTGPSLRFDEERVAVLAGLLKETAKQIQNSL